jgi:FkbM family methyltransferase
MKKIKYTIDKSIFITEESYKYQPDIFNTNGNIWEHKSLLFFYKSLENYYKNKLEKLVIIDIGAHVGLYTLYSKFFKNHTFYSFEPYNIAFNHLINNIKLNEIKNVKLFNIGLSNKIEQKLLKIPGGCKGLATLADKPIRMEKNHKKLIISVDTIDNLFFNKNIKVDFIKIDTEGWEYNIIKGGLKTINKYKPLIQLEINRLNLKQCNIIISELIKLLEELEYIFLYKSGEEFVFIHKSKKGLY